MAFRRWSWVAVWWAGCPAGPVAGDRPCAPFALGVGAGEMKHGVVWLDQTLDQANINPAAAHLLGLPAGEVPAGDFIAAMKRLEGRALNRSEVPAMGSSLLDDLSRDVDFTLRFAEAPTRVHVSSCAGRTLNTGSSASSPGSIQITPL